MTSVSIYTTTYTIACRNIDYVNVMYSFYFCVMPEGPEASYLADYIDTRFKNKQLTHLRVFLLNYVGHLIFFFLLQNV
jgi:hypothetical protein